MCVEIRPHHGLCIQFFEGKGYSDEFTAHMAKRIQKLREENPTISLCKRGDGICTHCPNHGETGCLTREKAERYDQKVLELCGLSFQQKLTWKEISGMIASHILASGRFPEVCGDCGWNEICRKKWERDFLQTNF